LRQEITDFSLDEDEGQDDDEGQDEASSVSTLQLTLDEFDDWETARRQFSAGYEQYLEEDDVVELDKWEDVPVVYTWQNWERQVSDGTGPRHRPDSSGFRLDTAIDSRSRSDRIVTS
jgi:hypothetical protein